MSRVEIEVGGWEQDCCGAELHRYTEIRWTVIVQDNGPLVETHHDLDGLETVEIAGTIVELEALGRDGTRVPITRVPSGSALSGNDPNDPGDVLELHTDRVVDVSGAGFVVTVEVRAG